MQAGSCVISSAEAIQGQVVRKESQCSSRSLAHGFMDLSRCGDTCVDIWVDMFDEICVGLCADMCADKCVGMCADMCVEIFLCLVFSNDLLG